MGPGETFIALILGITILGYVFFTARHRERMSMIDKGVNASFFVSKDKSGIRFTLKLGMLAIGASLGIIAGMTLRAIYAEMNEGIVVAMILLFGGISLIANFMVERKIDADEKND